MVLGVSVLAEPQLHHLPLLVHPVGVGPVGLPVGGGAVEEDQVHLQLQELGGGEVDRPGELLLALQKELGEQSSPNGPGGNSSSVGGSSRWV